MSALTDVRRDLKTLLADVVEGVPVFTELPERATAPFCVVAPGEPYLEFVEGVPFGACRLHLLACFYVAWGSNDIMAAALDDAALAIVNRVNDSDDFIVTQVDQPGQVAINNQAHLGIAVEIVTDRAL